MRTTIGEGTEGARPHTHTRSAELFYVLDGTVALHYGGERHVLDAGDSALLDGGTAHGWENLGTRKAQALWVILG